jgi:hypothetical protein
MKKILYSALLCLASNQLIAKCDPSIGKDFPGVEPPNYYGNAQTDSFRCAVNGSTELSSLQQSERNELIPEKLINRFYISFGVNAASEGIQGVQNESIFDTIAQQGTVSNKTVKTASNNIELAVGYAWKDFAIDLEWLGLKSISYNGSLVNIVPVIPYSTSVKGDALLLNLYWTFQNLYNFKFYALGCGGIGSNHSTSSIFGATPNVIKKISPAFGGGIGAQFNIISKLFADMSAKFIYLGRIKYEAANGTGRYITLRASRTWTGVSVRLIWLIYCPCNFILLVLSFQWTLL